ncbi:MAG: M15 family metallopeptidase [Rhabdochlamydiaceae bacterium]|nr:M15 family metallopeptidase [Candidatus Amphrikana amoebophyrae]
MSLVNIKDIDPSITIDIRYATFNNFTNQKLYSTPLCFLQDEVAKALKQAQNYLRLIGLGLKIFDGYRPLSVQKLLWDILPNPKFVADPHNGASFHNRGAAVDVTLINFETKQELVMPTEFDSFDNRAHSFYPDLPEKVIKNRSLLQYAMTKNGFEVLPTEWWHFNYSGGAKFALLDIPIGELNAALC